MLCDQPRDHPCQNVARAASSHARIPRRIHPYIAVRSGDQRAMALEHHNQVVLASEIARHVKAIRLNARDALAGEPRHFTRMWRNHDVFTLELVRLTFKRVQSICVKHDWQRVALHYLSYEFGGAALPRNARADGEHSLALN